MAYECYSPFRRQGNRGRRRRGTDRGAAAAGKDHDIPADQIDPVKVYVGNLRHSVSDHELKNVFSHYANVVRAFTIKDKHSHRSRGFGFVEVASPEDVEKLLALRDGDTYIQGLPAVIKHARKKNILPGDFEYVKPPLSDRLFDLEAENPSEPCIHILVDDVIYKILELLPLKTLIGVERVCRRWQMIVYKLFARRASFNLSKDTLDVYGPLTRSIVGKLLILMGPTLKELKVESVDHSTRHNILRIIAQLCPELESLDVTQTMGINFSNLKFLSKGCKNLKKFIAQECHDFDDRSLKEILQSYPELEHLDIGGWDSDGKVFKILPESLKVLGLSNCIGLHKANLKCIGDRCPNLEELNLHQLAIPGDTLEHIGTKCPTMKKLDLSIATSSSAESLLFFKHLKVLHLEAEVYFEISTVIEHMEELEDLSIKGAGEDVTQKTKLNFSTFKHLKTLELMRVIISVESLRTLSKCPTLKSLRLNIALDSELFLNILRGCPQLESFSSSKLDVTAELVKSVNEIMKNRTGPIKIVAPLAQCIKVEDYDQKKIKLENFSLSLYYLLSEDGDFDDFFDYDNDSIFSGDSIDEWFMYGGYASDSSFPDHWAYGGHFFDDYDLPDELDPYF